MVIEKKLRATILTTGLLAGCSTQEDSAWTSDFGSVARAPVIRNVSNIPLEVRNVPIHSGDIGYPGPINDKTRRNYARVALDPRIGYKIIDNEETAWNVGVGFEIGWNFSNGAAERNYHDPQGGDDRGAGAALTYYSIHSSFAFPWNQYVFPHAFTELTQKISENVSVGLGFDVQYEQTYIENGWDRYDNYSAWKRYGLADVVRGTPYIHFDFKEKGEKMGMGIDLGLPFFLHKNEHRIGKEADVTYNNPGWYVALRYRF